MWTYEESADRITWTTVAVHLTSAELEAAIRHGQWNGLGFWRAINETTGRYL